MEIRSIRSLVESHPLLADLPEADIDLIAGCGRNVRFRAGDLLLREGEEANTFYLLRSGRVSVELTAPGRQTLVVRTVDAGDLVGWSWLIPPYRWHLDARAVDAVAAVSIDGACLRRKCDADHSLGYRLMQRFAQVAVDHLQAARLQLADLYAPPGPS